MAKIKQINIDALIEQDQERRQAEKMIKEHRKRSKSAVLIKVKVPNDTHNTTFFIREGKDPSETIERYNRSRQYTNLPSDLLK